MIVFCGIFFWPKLQSYVSRYIKSCQTCQLTSKPSWLTIPAVSQPFKHLVIDCVGPLPPSKSGCLYLLTVMYQTTRYPAAYPLRLSQFISVFGIPRVIKVTKVLTSRLISSHRSLSSSR